ncbi:MAG: hypothetical protein ABJA71_07910 [Ginsengibacter sp.]
MKNNLSIKNKIDATLNSIDNLAPASPSPFFYTKIMAKIRHDQPSLWEKWSIFFLRPTIAFATICLVIAINVFVIYSNITGSFSLSDDTESALADEYSLATTTLYDIENLTP